MPLYFPPSEGFPHVSAASLASQLAAYDQQGDGIQGSGVLADGNGFIAEAVPAPSVYNQTPNSGNVEWNDARFGLYYFLVEGALDLDIDTNMTGAFPNALSDPITVVRKVAWEQDATGGHAVTFSSSNANRPLIWEGGSPPTWATAANAVNFAIFEYVPDPDFSETTGFWLGRGFVNFS